MWCCVCWFVVLVRGTFTVLDNVPAQFRHGIFSSPSSKSAWIRYSNGKQFFGSDLPTDVRGMAVKVMGVEGEKYLK